MIEWLVLVFLALGAGGLFMLLPHLEGTGYSGATLFARARRWAKVQVYYSGKYDKPKWFDYIAHVGNVARYNVGGRKRAFVNNITDYHVVPVKAGVIETHGKDPLIFHIAEDDKEARKLWKEFLEPRLKYFDWQIVSKKKASSKNSSGAKPGRKKV